MTSTSSVTGMGTLVLVYALASDPAGAARNIASGYGK